MRIIAAPLLLKLIVVTDDDDAAATATDDVCGNKNQSAHYERHLLQIKGIWFFIVFIICIKVGDIKLRFELKIFFGFIKLPSK